MPAPPVRIEVPRGSGRATASRVEANVDGVSVWFESDDVPLAPAPEAWASAFLIPALHVRRPLDIEAAMDPQWAANAARLARRACRDWGYGPQLLRLTAAPAPVASPGADRGRGLFFTGGVDSFHALLCTDEHPDRLVNVHGFDVPLADAARHGAARATIEAVAAATGTRPLFLRTNLREHPLFLEAPWNAAHGGALAAAGHVLSRILRRIAIGSSQPRWSSNPWGSNWRTDPLWSSTALEFVHLDPDLDRLGKIRRIAPHALVREHLRVCWSQSGPRANCSRCEKCMLTMLGLAEAGVLSECTAFEQVDLLALVRARRRSRWRLPMLHELARSPRLDPELRQALRAMWWRSVLWRSTGIRWGVQTVRRLARRPRAHRA
jgi:hypothetical protein